MLEETEKIEAYIKEHCSGHIHGAYGCSLGDSFVGLLAARQNIHMDYGILGGTGKANRYGRMRRLEPLPKHRRKAVNPMRGKI